MKETKAQDPTTPTLQHANPPLAESDLTEFQTILTDIKGCSAEFKNLPGTLRSLQDENARLSTDLQTVRRSVLSRSPLHTSRSPGRVTDDCARHLAAT